MEKRDLESSDLFWVLMVWVGALLGGGIFAVVIGRIAGAGAGAGIFFGAILFVGIGLFVASFTAVSTLPPPNTLTAPTVPRRGPSAGVPAAQRADDPVGGSVQKASFKAGEALGALGATVGQAAADLGGAVSKAASDVGDMVSRKDAEPSDQIRPVMMTPAAEPPVEVAPVEAPIVTEAAMTRPAGIAAPRETGADNLKKIKGVGPRLEELLNGLGFYHFDQIAAWTSAEVAWVDAHLEGFNGRATRDDWVAQSRILAGGGETEFSQRVDRGDVY